MEFAVVDDFADVVGVVGADVGETGGVGGEVGVGGGLDPLFEVGHAAVVAGGEGGPLGGGDVVDVVADEGVLVVAGVGCGFLAAEAGEGVLVPVDEVGDELRDGVHLGSGGCGAGGVGEPAGLLGREVGDGGVEGDEPLGFVVGGVELLEQDSAQGGGFGLGGLRGCERSGDQESGGKDGGAHCGIVRARGRTGWEMQ